MNNPVDPKDGFDLLEYPNSFEFKAMCNVPDGLCLVTELTRIIESLLGTNSVESSRTADSRTGKYKSVTLSVKLENRQQLEGVYQALSESPHVVMTL